MAAASSTLGVGSYVRRANSQSAPQRPLATLVERVAAGDVRKAASYFEANFDASRMSLAEFASAPYETRDLVLMMFKVLSELDRPEALAQLLVTAIRDVPRQQLNAAYFDGFLQALASCKTFSRDRVLWALTTMTELGIDRTEKTYLALGECIVRMEGDLQPLWDELLALEATTQNRLDEAAAIECSNNRSVGLGDTNAPVTNPLTPSLAMVKMTLLQSALRSTDVTYSMGVMRRMLTLSPVDLGLLAKFFVTLTTSAEATADDALWILFEIEQRCVLARQKLEKVVQKKDLVMLLKKCALNADSATAERTVAVMERHLVPKTSDVYGLLVWCYANAGLVERAIDTAETMARKGQLDTTDAWRRFTIEALGETMEKHFLMTLADSLHTIALVDRAYFYLEKRYNEGLSVSVHVLDVVVLACSKLNDDARAAETVENYAAMDVSPRATTYNALLLSCVGRTKAKQYQAVFAAMVKNGVAPNSQTMRMLIRQAVVSDNVDEAVSLLERVPSYPNLRVEVEMILPILERAGRVGDVSTATKMAKYALHCDIGIDASTLRAVCANLKVFGVDCGAIEEAIPVHERLRTRSKVSRRRIVHDLKAL